MHSLPLQEEKVQRATVAKVNKMTNVLLLYFIIRKFFLVKHAFLLIFLVLLQFALLRCKNIFYFDTKCVF